MEISTGPSLVMPKLCTERVPSQVDDGRRAECRPGYRRWAIRRSRLRTHRQLAASACLLPPLLLLQWSTFARIEIVVGRSVPPSELQLVRKCLDDSARRCTIRSYLICARNLARWYYSRHA